MVRGRKDLTDTKRPFYLGILNADGQVLRALEIQPDGTTEEVTEREQSKPPKPRPEAAEGEEGHPPE